MEYEMPKTKKVPIKNYFLQVQVTEKNYDTLKKLVSEINLVLMDYTEKLFYSNTSIQAGDIEVGIDIEV